jgi:PEP-CTERM motif
MNSRKNTIYAVLIGLFVVGGLAPAVMGQLPTLTAAGMADGFSLTTFATTNPGNTGCCAGPFGVAVASSGNIIVANGAGNRYVFADTDGQTVGTALFTQPSNSFTAAYATAGGQAYGVQDGHFVQFNPDGTVNHVLTGVTTSVDLGMWGNPVTGHIEASSGSGLIDINPLANGGTGSFRVINASGDGDGVSVSPDGKTVYSEQGDIRGYDIASGTQVFSSSPAAFPSPDGTGVISSTNNLNGDIIVNNNNGEVDLLDPVTKAVTVIATGGSRGDYTSPDTNNGTLFLDFADVVGRLSCGADCSIGGPPPPPTTPEPASLILLGTGLAALAGFKKKKLNQA